MLAAPSEVALYLVRDWQLMSRALGGDAGQRGGGVRHRQCCRRGAGRGRAPLAAQRAGDHRACASGLLPAAGGDRADPARLFRPRPGPADRAGRACRLLHHADPAARGAACRARQLVRPGAQLRARPHVRAGACARDGGAALSLYRAPDRGTGGVSGRHGGRIHRGGARHGRSHGPGDPRARRRDDMGPCDGRDSGRDPCLCGHRRAGASRPAGGTAGDPRRAGRGNGKASGRVDRHGPRDPSGARRMGRRDMGIRAEPVLRQGAGRCPRRACVRARCGGNPGHHRRGAGRECGLPDPRLYRRSVGGGGARDPAHTRAGGRQHCDAAGHRSAVRAHRDHGAADRPAARTRGGGDHLPRGGDGVFSPASSPACRACGRRPGR